MSAYVSYSIAGFDATGEQVTEFPVRAVSKPAQATANALAQEVNPSVVTTLTTRSIPARIGHMPVRTIVHQSTSIRFL